MSDLAIFLVGSFTSLLCVLFVLLTVREVRRTERELERGSHDPRPEASWKS